MYTPLEAQDRSFRPRNDLFPGLLSFGVGLEGVSRTPRFMSGEGGVDRQSTTS